MGLVAIVLGLMSAWVAWQWTPAVVPATLFFGSAIFLFWLSLHPVIEVSDRELSIGKRVIPWSSITKIDTTGWLTPLILKLTVDGGKRVVMVFAGDIESSGGLKELV